MPSGRPRTLTPTVSDEDKATLKRWLRRKKTQRGLAVRAQIVLLAGDGVPDVQIAQQMQVSRPTVARWRRRYKEHGIDGLHDEPRPGAPRSVSDEDVEEIITLTLEHQPANATHWSTRSLAERTGHSHVTVHRVWKAFGLQPHRREYFKLSTDPLFVDKVRDVVGLYLNPPEKALVLCVDEKSQIQALNRTQPLIPLRPGQAERGTHDYERHGTASLFAALNVATGEVIGKCYSQHRAQEFKKFLALIDRQVPAQLDVHVVVDNYCTHKAPVVRNWLNRHPRFKLHFTPTYSSWINQVERFFGLLTERMLRRGVHRSVKELTSAIDRYIAVHNENPKPFTWTKDADAILSSIARYCTYLTREQSEFCNDTSVTGH